MTIANLSEVLLPARKNGYAVAGVVTLGWEDARAYTKAAEIVGCPIILQAGPSCREHTPLPILGKMLLYLAENASVPVVVHLDHSYSLEECQLAINYGFTSVMIDGSKLELAKNIDLTSAVAELAHPHNISCEGEIGFVGYNNGNNSELTNPDDAALFAKETNVDAMAISAGNTHLQLSDNTEINADLVRDIQEKADTPLVIHGGSGVKSSQRLMLAKTTNICKFNIGTELRQCFGKSIRKILSKNPDTFDRVKILSSIEPDLVDATIKSLLTMGYPKNNI